MNPSSHFRLHFGDQNIPRSMRTCAFSMLLKSHTNLMKIIQIIIVLGERFFSRWHYTMHNCPPFKQFYFNFIQILWCILVGKSTHRLALHHCRISDTSFSGQHTPANSSCTSLCEKESVQVSKYEWPQGKFLPLSTSECLVIII